MKPKPKNIKMKKVLFVLTAAVAFSFASCKKCIECTYEYGGVKATSGEVCGKKKEIDDVKALWEGYGKTYGVTTQCVDK